MSLATRALDRVIAALSPQWAVSRSQARQILAYYEAASPSRTLKKRREGGSGNTAVGRAGRSLREQARHLEQNLDIARGILDTLVTNIVGPAGIGIEPQPRRADGSIHQECARAIRELLRDWERRPEVTWRHNWAACQRLTARGWVRDGESLGQILEGSISQYRHGSRLPLSLELFEADFLPLDLSDAGRNIVHGVELDRWGRPLRYHLYQHHPGDLYAAAGSLVAATRIVPAGRMVHLALTDRLHQVRGVSVFASVLERLEDLKDYEESERVAAKVAASMAAFIRKGTPDLYRPADYDGDEPEKRHMRFAAGMIFDDLLPGEDVGTINTSRPNPQLEPHRKGQLRAVSSGVRVGYSSAAKDYDGSYSSQRQEMIESYAHYGQLQSHFIGQFVQPIYERAVGLAASVGLLSVPADVIPATLDDALYLAPQMPWIDPQKEAGAWEIQERNCYASGPEIIRRRGLNPRDVVEQQLAWEDDKRRIREARAETGAEPQPQFGPTHAQASRPHAVR
jgi:lambda family phage portal protein